MKNKFLVFILIVSLVFTGLPFRIKNAKAAALTNISDTQTNQTAGALSSHNITFITPSGINASATVTLDFDNGTSISGITASDIYLSVNGVTATTSVSGTGTTVWYFAYTSGTITITAPTTGTPAAPGATIVIKVGSQVPGGTDRITNGPIFTTNLTIGGSMADSATIQLFVVSNSIVNIVASVAPTISFSVSATVLQFGNLGTSFPRYATTTTGGSGVDTIAHDLIVATNSMSGFSITLQGSTLTASTGTITPITGSPSTSSPGSAQFGLYATLSGGSGVSVATNYATPSSFFFGANATTTDTLGSGTMPTANATYSVHYIANISGSTPAGSYTSNITYIATPQF